MDWFSYSTFVFHLSTQNTLYNMTYSHKHFFYIYPAMNALGATQYLAQSHFDMQTGAPRD